jgi:hypothetical protein
LSEVNVDGKVKGLARLKVWQVVDELAIKRNLAKSRTAAFWVKKEGKMSGSRS